jgi:hypothetical protein
MRDAWRKIAHLVQLIAVVAAGFVFCVAGNAQVPTSGNVFFGYSYSNAGPLFGLTKRGNLNGWEGSLEGKVLPWIGLVVDFSGHYGSQQVPCAVPVDCFIIPTANVHEQDILFGPRVSMSVGKIRPFAEALFGAGHISTDNGGGSDTSFATALGGGIDYKIIRPVAWRFEGDYVQTRFFGTTQNNVRLSTGIVLRF